MVQSFHGMLIRVFLFFQKRQIRSKLKQLDQQPVVMTRYEYIQQKILPLVLIYSYHTIDLILIPVAIVREFMPSLTSLSYTLLIYNIAIIGVLTSIILGEVMETISLGHQPSLTYLPTHLFDCICYGFEVFHFL